MKLRAVLWSFALSVGLIVPSVFAAAQGPPASSGTQAGTDTAKQPSGNTAAQTSGNSGAAASAQTPDQSSDPLKRPLTDKQKKANSKALKQELSGTYKKWLNQDVVYIITPEEKTAF